VVKALDFFVEHQNLRRIAAQHAGSRRNMPRRNMPITIFDALY
jgi:hypothetical protein